MQRRRKCHIDLGLLCGPWDSILKVLTLLLERIRDFLRMRYINWHFTYLLTYLLTLVSNPSLVTAEGVWPVRSKRRNFGKSRSEMEMGQWVMDHGSNGSPFWMGHVGHGSQPVTHWPMMKYLRSSLQFLRATAYMLSAHMLSQFRPSVCPSVRLSVCLSVTRVDQSKTVEVRIMQFSPYSSSIPLVFVR